MPSAKYLRLLARIAATGSVVVNLVSDKAGECGRNLDNPDQPRRYEFEAQLVRYPNPDRRPAQQVQPRLEKPC